MTWTLCTSGAAINKAGFAVSGTYVIGSGALLANWSDEAENYACSLVRSDVITNFGSLTSNGKQIFQELTSSYIGEKIINYNITAFTTRGEATLMMNVLENNINRCSKLISDDKYKTYLKVVT